MITTLLTILVGLQLVQTVALVMLFRFAILRHKAQKLTDIKNNEMVLHIIESRLTPERGFNRWLLFEPGSLNHPSRKRRVDRFKTALDALEYADATYPGIRVEITDSHYDIIPTQDVRDGTRIEAA